MVNLEVVKYVAETMNSNSTPFVVQIFSTGTEEFFCLHLKLEGWREEIYL